MAPRVILALLLLGTVRSEDLQSCYSNIPFTEECKASFPCLATAASLCLSGGMNMGDKSLTCGGVPVVVNGQCAPAAPPGIVNVTTPQPQPDPIVCTSCLTFEMSRSPECLAACPAFANCTNGSFTTDIDTSCTITCKDSAHPMGEQVVINGVCPSKHLADLYNAAQKYGKKSAKGMLGLMIFLGICGCCCLVACIAGIVYMLGGKSKRSRKQEADEEEDEVE